LEDSSWIITVVRGGVFTLEEDGNRQKLLEMLHNGIFFSQQSPTLVAHM